MRDGIALEIAIARVEHGVPTRGAARQFVVGARTQGAGAFCRPLVGLCDNPRRLLPKRLGQSLVTSAHLVMGCVAL